MRFYGTIRTNLGKLCRECGIDSGYSVDSLMFETKDGDFFNIDFEEGDYGISDSFVSFRLKSLGITFMDEWEDLEGKTVGVGFENDYKYFRSSILRSISFYIPDNPEITEELISKLKFKVEECYLQLAGGEVYYKPSKVVVDYL